MGALRRFCAAKMMIDPSGAIREVIRGDWSRPVSESVKAVNETLLRRHGHAVRAVLFYGSSLSHRIG